MNELKNYLGLSQLTEEEHKKLWDQTGPLQIKMIEKSGECRHNLGDVFVYTKPFQRPKGVCYALLHVLEAFVWRVSLGFPSWESDDRSIYRIHCPSKKGTVWEMKRMDNQEGI